MTIPGGDNSPEDAPRHEWARLTERGPKVEVVRGHRGAPTVMRVQLPSSTKSASLARNLVSVLLIDRGVHEDCRSDVVLAVSEASSNALEYGAGPHVDMCVEIDDASCLVTLSNQVREARQRDGAIGVEAFGAEPDLTMPDAGATRGRGVAIMDIVMDSVAIEVSGDRCVVEMVRRVDR